MKAFRLLISVSVLCFGTQVQADACRDAESRAHWQAHQAALSNTLATRTAPGDLLVAALLHPSAQPSARCEAGRWQIHTTKADPEARELLEAAMRAAWNAPELLALTLSAPAPRWAANDTLKMQAAQRLLALGPENLAHWDLAFRAAVARQASEVELAELVSQAAAQSTYVDSGWTRLLQEIERSARALPIADTRLAALNRDELRSAVQGHDEVELRKEASARVLVHLGVPDRIERPQPRTLDEGHYRIGLASAVAATTLPVPEVSRYCVQRARTGSISPTLAADCLQIGQRMLDQADTVMGASMGAALLARLASNEAEREAAINARVMLDWLNSGRHLPNRGACLALDMLDEPCSEEERMWEGLAELEASFALLEPGATEMRMLRARLEASRQPEPPADWIETQRAIHADLGR